jgi:hypothetical protein
MEESLGIEVHGVLPEALTGVDGFSWKLAISKVAV